MFSLLKTPQNGRPVVNGLYRKRLQTVLGGEEDLAGYLPAECPTLPGVSPEFPESTTSGALAPATDGQVPGQESCMRDGSAQTEPNTEPWSARMGMEKAAKAIAETLLGTLGRAVKDVQQQAASDKTRLEAAFETLFRQAGEIHQTRTEVSNLSTQVETLVMEQTQQASRFTQFDARMSEEELGFHLNREQISRLSAQQEGTTQQVQGCNATLRALEAHILQMGERLEALEQGVQSQTATSARLISLCEKLDELHRSLAERVDDHQDLIQVLRTEVRQPIGMLERITRSLRVLDLRKESRFPVEEHATVAIQGEPEAVSTARIVDASDSGLGLMLDKPLPPNAEVCVGVNNTSFTGKVVYCLPKDGKHTVGLKLSQPLHASGKTRTRPSNPEILAQVRSVYCR